MKDKLSENLLKDLYKTVVQNGPMDKRRHQRKDCLINVDISASNSCSNCYLLDINHNGAYIETDQSFSIDQLVSLYFVDPDSRKSMTVGGIVVRTDPQGVGILFEGLTSSQLRSLQLFTESEEKIYEIKS